MGTFFSQHFNDLFDEDMTHGSGPILTDGSPSSRSKLNWTASNETPRPRVLECDPRSPTVGVTRTPIEVLSAPKGHQASYESRYSNLSYEHTPCTVREPNDKFSWMDPRSPALGLGFTRTPIRFLDVNDSTEETNDEDIEQVSPLNDSDEPTEEDKCDASHTNEDIERALDVALVDESTEDVCHTAEDIERVLDVPLVVAQSTEGHDASIMAEDIEQVSCMPPIAKLTEDDHHDASQAAEDVDQESREALVAESTAKDHVQGASAQEERVHQEISRAIDVGCKSSTGKHTSEVATPIRHTLKINTPTSRVDDLKRGVLNTSLTTPDMSKSIEKAKRFIVDKENSSSVKKQVFHTPETKTEDGANPKVRTPLGVVCGNNSPLQMLRDKQSNVVKKSLSSRPSQFTQFNRTTIQRP